MSGSFRAEDKQLGIKNISYNVINRRLLFDTQYCKVLYSSMGKEEELGCEPRSSPATSATGVILSLSRVRE